MRSTLKWGALIGVAIYILSRLLIPFISSMLLGGGPADLNHPAVLMSACLGIFLELFAFSAAGYLAGRDTLRPGLGAVAGMVAMALYDILSALYTPGGNATTVTSAATHLSTAAQFISAVVAGALVFGIAALMGWLGGRPGAQNARKRMAASTVSATTSNA